MGVLTYHFANFLQKLHKNERISTPREVGARLGAALYPPMVWINMVHDK